MILTHCQNLPDLLMEDKCSRSWVLPGPTDDGPGIDWPIRAVLDRGRVIGINNDCNVDYTAGLVGDVDVVGHDDSDE